MRIRHSAISTKVSPVRPSLIPGIVSKFTVETLRIAAKQSEPCHTVPVRLRRAIKKYLRDQEAPNMRRKVLSLSQSLNGIKEVNLQLAATTSKALIGDPLKSESSKRWKITSSYGDIGFKYCDEHTIAYVASRMPAVFCACFRVLSEVKRRLPGFSPASVLDFGAGTGSAFWALREVWPRSLERINLVEPSQSMQRAGQSLIKDEKNLPLIHSYDSLMALARKINKSERRHDLVIASYVLGEIASLKDRFTIVRQLWDLTQDVLVLVEPGTPQGANIISQLRSHILWMEKRKCRKLEAASKVASKDLITEKIGVHIVAPCPHDGVCPLHNTEKYCHFVQRLERTTSQRAYKRSKGVPLRGFEDEKFCYVAFRRGPRPREPWPLDGIKFDTLKEQRAKRNPEDLIDYEDPFDSELEELPGEEDIVKNDSVITGRDMVTEDEEEEEEEDIVKNDSVITGRYTFTEDEEEDDDGEEEEEVEETARADVGSGWGRIVYSPVRRGRLVEMNICRSTNREGSKGCFERVVVTKSKNPVLHHQARKSLWGDLWPC